MEEMESKRTDQYRTFRAKVVIQTLNPLAKNEKMVWTRYVFFRSWESCAKIAGLGCVMEQVPKLFSPKLQQNILSVHIEMLHSANEQHKPLFTSVFQWARTNDQDIHDIKLQLGDLLSRERRQIRDIEFLRVA